MICSVALWFLSYWTKNCCDRDKLRHSSSPDWLLFCCSSNCFLFYSLCVIPDSVVLGSQQETEWILWYQAWVLLTALFYMSEIEMYYLYSVFVYVVHIPTYQPERDSKIHLYLLIFEKPHPCWKWCMPDQVFGLKQYIELSFGANNKILQYRTNTLKLRV